MRKRRADRRAFPLVIAAGSDGLSFRWPTPRSTRRRREPGRPPLRVVGTVLHDLTPELAGPEVTLVHADGKLAIGTTLLSAAEV